MEVVAATPGAPVAPFHDHDVREWSRIDSLTGVLERARLETDHWTTNTNNSYHKYGKVVDSRARTNADGALQQQARRQLEVFQSQIPGAHLQVIKTQSFSTSRWSHNQSNHLTEIPVKDFENLQLSLNPLDLSSEKSKANVGRSVSRRPPSRIRPKDEATKDNFYRVSRLCNQIHENAVKRLENGHHNLIRTKSTSSEDLHLEDKSCKSIEDLEDLEQLQNWRRSSKLRRSLQYPKQSQPPKTIEDLPESKGSVRKIKEELEKGRRLSTALRGNHINLEALDQILQTISSSSNSSQSESPEELEPKREKRNSFVTVEKLQEVRGRLRRTSTPTDHTYETNKDEEIDDGIVTEDTNEMPIGDKSRVRSYVYGMENINKNSMLGTGSLESRTKLLNGGTNLRNEDWYNRRKSYGFEQMHNHTDTSSSISLRNKTRVESSTDSGICHSSEIVITPTSHNGDDKSFTSVKQISSIFDQSPNNEIKSTTIKIPIVSKPNSNFVDLSWDDVPEKESKRHSIAVDETQYVSADRFRKAGLAAEEAQNRKSKKVEFCKTEVHFAADSGKVNIVETDEKPPPTNNFRRRRRNSGPISSEDFERNGLPVLHFGDSNYEKELLGVTDETSSNHNLYQSHYSGGTVTVNNKSNPIDLQDDDKTQDFNENVKGILKNKPIKPTPYHLGEEPPLQTSNSDSDSSKWGVRLKPVQKNDSPPYWKSTVTLHNTVYDQAENTNNNQPEFQKLLRNLRPTNGNKPDLLANQRSSENFSTVKFVTSTQNNRRPWSVADRVQLNEDTQWAENNKVYSTKVNFGDGGAAVVENDRLFRPNHVWKENAVKDSEKILNKGLVVRIGRNDCSSKHTVCSKTTSKDSNTTTTTKITIDLSPSPTNNSIPTLVPQPKQRSHSFKSTSLVLDCLKANHINIPQQLEALKKLYEDVQSDSDADKEVQVLMSQMDREESKDDNTSEISGSWSKMKASRLRNELKIPPNAKIADAKIEKEETNVSIKHKIGRENSLTSSTYETDQTSSKYKIRLKENKHSPIITRKTSSFAKTSSSNSNKLSSPSLVTQTSKIDLNGLKTTKGTDFVNITDEHLHKKHSTNDIVLRQPKKSEMTYFGVKSSSISTKKESVIPKLSEKPDLLQHMKTNSPKTQTKFSKIETYSSPIYENINKKNEFDSNIMEELTKAADEILQAVNNFTDDDEDEEPPQKKLLDTIAETKSWSQDKQNKTTKKQTNVRSKMKHTSSNSSIESLPRNRNPLQTKVIPLKKKTTPNENVNPRAAATKARRLQRASSREALLQSHGSSSEDLGANIEVPVRKPRQIKKTKALQMSVSNGLEVGKKTTLPNPPRRKRDDLKERTDAVPEIRHKTAISTIKSTQDKSSREQSKSRIEESKKRLTTLKKELPKGLSSRSNSRRTTPVSNHRISTANIKKCPRAEETSKH